MKNLIVDCRMIDESGIGRYLCEVTKNIDPFTALVFDNQKNKIFNAGREIIIKSSIYNPAQNIEIPMKLKGESNMIYWSPHYNIPWFGMKSFKKIVTVHDVFHVSKLSNLSPLKKEYAKLMLKKALEADIIITVSEFSKNEIVSEFGTEYESKIHVIHNGVDPHKHCFTKEESEHLLASLGIKKNYILAVGNVKPHKNLKTLIEAFASSDQLSDNFQLVIVGRNKGFISNEKFMGDIGKLVSSNKLIFTGYVDDQQLSKLYSSSSTLVFPSFYEGFGLPGLEAQAHAVPVIASEIGVFKEVYSDSVLYFDPNSYQNLQNLLLELLVFNKNTSLEFVKRGNENIKRFSWEESVRMHRILLNQL